MSKQRGMPLTPVQHLQMARVGLVSTHARLERFGEASGEDPVALGRVESAMELIRRALLVLSAEEDEEKHTEEVLPF